MHPVVISGFEGRDHALILIFVVPNLLEQKKKVKNKKINCFPF
jgi:hypothetical protein